MEESVLVHVQNFWKIFSRVPLLGPAPSRIVDRCASENWRQLQAAGVMCDDIGIDRNHMVIVKVVIGCQQGQRDYACGIAPEGKCERFDFTGASQALYQGKSNLSQLASA